MPIVIAAQIYRTPDAAWFNCRVLRTHTASVRAAMCHREDGTAIQPDCVRNVMGGWVEVVVLAFSAAGEFTVQLCGTPLLGASCVVSLVRASELRVLSAAGLAPLPEADSLANALEIPLISSAVAVVSTATPTPPPRPAVSEITHDVFLSCCYRDCGCALYPLRCTFDDAYGNHRSVFVARSRVIPAPFCRFGLPGQLAGWLAGHAANPASLNEKTVFIHGDQPFSDHIGRIYSFPMRATALFVPAEVIATVIPRRVETRGRYIQVRPQTEVTPCE